jgi:uncharacterized membrane protein
MGKGRLEAFSDGVLAIALTIMVLEIKVPLGPDLAALRPVLPRFLSYVLSFIFIGTYWSNHHHVLQATQRINGTILLANLHLLFWLSLVPAVTGWLGENPNASMPAALYGAVMLMSGVAYWLLEQAIVAYNGRDSALAAAVGRDFKGIGSLVMYSLAIAAAFLRPWLAEVLYVLVVLLWVIPDSRIEKKIAVATPVHGIPGPES